MKRIAVLRIGHRKKRDPRLSTHVALAARAFGAQTMFLSGDEDQELIKSINKAVANWGGDFAVKYVKSWRSFLNSWQSRGKSVHLTMYGQDPRKVIDDIRSCDGDLLIIVGSQKVPKDVFQVVDWNVSITNQPHSEVSALAVFMHMLLRGKEFDIQFAGARLRVIPSSTEKVVKAAPHHPSS